MKKYNFRLAKENELDDVLYLIQQRINWMDEIGIEQWNKTKYFERYPRIYFEGCITRHELYVMSDDTNAKIVGAVVLASKDKQWLDDGTAFYIRNLVTALGENGLGEIVLKNCERLAKEKNKQKLRLDCQAQNTKLNSYYEKLGFVYMGQAQDGVYQGNKREKVLC